jgi:hypothetical protein
MMTYTWKFLVRLSNGSAQEICVRADDIFNAKAMLEAQYGKGSVIGGGSQVD